MITIDELQDMVNTWQRVAFHNPTAKGALAHMLSEAAEAFFSMGGTDAEAMAVLAHAHQKRPGSVPEEIADTVLLALGASNVIGFSLETEVMNKFERVQKRSYDGGKNALGFTEHVQEEHDDTERA